MPPAKRQRNSKPPKFADPAVLAEAVKDMPITHLDCRLYGHNWLPRSAHWNQRDKVWDVILRCGRCKTPRPQTWTDSGEVVADHRNYVPGYLLPRGTGRVDGRGKAVLRVNAVHRYAQRNGDT